MFVNQNMAVTPKSSQQNTNALDSGDSCNKADAMLEVKWHGIPGNLFHCDRNGAPDHR